MSGLIWWNGSHHHIYKQDACISNMDLDRAFCAPGSIMIMIIPHHHLLFSLHPCPPWSSLSWSCSTCSWSSWSWSPPLHPCPGILLPLAGMSQHVTRDITHVTPEMGHFLYFFIQAAMPPITMLLESWALCQAMLARPTWLTLVFENKWDNLIYHAFTFARNIQTI